MANTIYSFDPITGAFVSEMVADKSPLEPGVLLFPAFTTIIKPPKAVTNEVAVFAGGQWQVKADWRGVTLFSTTDGSAVAITEIGKTPADVCATETPPPGRGYTYINGEWVIDAKQQVEIINEEQRQRLAEIDAQLATIDAASARPAREIALAMGQGESASTVAITKLTELESLAAALRAERQKLRVS